MSSFVVASPEVFAAAASDLSGIGLAVRSAHGVAAASTTRVVVAAQDEVSAAISALFGAFGQEFQAAGTQAALFHERFVAALSAGQGAYSAAEAASASPLAAMQQDVMGVVNSPTQALLGRPLIGNGANGAAGSGAAGGAGGFCWVMGVMVGRGRRVMPGVRVGMRGCSVVVVPGVRVVRGRPVGGWSWWCWGCGWLVRRCGRGWRGWWPGGSSAAGVVVMAGLAVWVGLRGRCCCRVGVRAVRAVWVVRVRLAPRGRPVVRRPRTAVNGEAHGGAGGAGGWFRVVEFGGCRRGGRYWWYGGIGGAGPRGGCGHWWRQRCCRR